MKPKDQAALEKLRAVLPPGPAPAAPPPEKAHAVGRAIVRMERKGRGGKEVTIVELREPPKDLERWCRDLKQALGCGGSVDSDRIVLQGDLRPRIAAVLEARGVARVTIG